MQHPALRDVCARRCSISIWGAPRADEVERLRVRAGGPAARRGSAWPSTDESLALSTALLAQRGLGIDSAPIVLRTRTESGLGALLHAHTSAGRSNLRVFPFLDRTCTVAAVDAGIREQLALRGRTSNTSPTAPTHGGASDVRRPLGRARRRPARSRAGVASTL